MALTDFDVQQYLNYIDLQEDTVDYNVMQQLLLIDQKLFQDVLELMINDYKNGIEINDISQVFRQVANLPHINNTTVTFLYDSITDNTTIRRLKHHFIETGSPVLNQPGYPILDMYKTQNLVPFIEYANKKYQDYKSMLITPNIASNTQQIAQSHYEFSSLDELVTSYVYRVSNSVSIQQKRLELDTIAGDDFIKLRVALDDFTNKLQFINTPIQNYDYFLNENFIGLVLRNVYNLSNLSPKFIDNTKRLIVQSQATGDYRQSDGLDSVLQLSQYQWVKDPVHTQLTNQLFPAISAKIFWGDYYKTKFGHTSTFINSDDILFFEKYIEFMDKVSQYLVSLKEVSFDLVENGE